MQQENCRIFASIDVGSIFLRMMIANIMSDGTIIVLEDLYMPTNLGRDTFASGRISVESIHDCCAALNGFVQVMNDYQVKRYRAVCTSALREAENREYVVEQIRMRTGLKLELINSAEERFFIHKDLRDTLPGAKQIRSEGMLIVSMGMGGVEVSVYEAGRMQSTEYVKAGLLRLRQVLHDLERMTLDFPRLMEEYLESKIYFLKSRIPALKVKNFIGIGSEMQTIAELCSNMGFNENENRYFIMEDAIEKLYGEISRMTTPQIEKKFKLDRNKADILLPSLIIIRHFLRMTDASGAWVPPVSLRHGILAEEVDREVDTERKHAFAGDIVSSIWYLGKKYDIDTAHAAHVEKLSMAIFEQTLRIHRMKKKEDNYLRFAAILHDVGHFVSANDHQIHSYEIIRSQDIFGLSDKDLNIISNVTRYHNEDIPLPSHENYRLLSNREKLTVSKLAAIMKLAEALDISHKQKIKGLKIKKSGRKLHFFIKSNEETLLEEWNFQKSARFFEELMGYQPVLERGGGGLI